MIQNLKKELLDRDPVVETLIIIIIQNYHLTQFTHMENEYSSGYVHDLNRLQHVGNSNDKITRFDHPPGLEKRECFIEVAFHVIREA